MIILNATTKTLEIDLAGAITTSQLPVTVNYVDVTLTAYTPISTDTATNSTTAVTIVSAPAASTQRQVKLITVYNADTASATVTIQLNNNSTLRILVNVVLAVGSTLIYTDGEGWRVLTSAGAIVTSTLSPMTSAQLAAILSDETGTNLAVFNTSPTLVTPVLGVASATSLAVPAITTASGDLTITPAAGSDVIIALSGSTGDFTITSADVSKPVFRFENSNSDSNPPAMFFLKTSASPANNDLLGQYSFYGLDSGATSTRFATVFVRSADVTDGSEDGSIHWKTMVAGTDTEVVTMTGGNFGIGATSPGGKLDTRQGSTTAAIPTVYLQQADVSEEWFEFDTTIGAGNAIEAVGVTVFTPTHYLKITIPGGLTRYIRCGTFV